MANAEFRIEHDSMGELQVPASALWGGIGMGAVAVPLTVMLVRR